MSKNYTVNEIFYSTQGEGMRAGEASVFIRFTGCNMQCSQQEGDKSPGGFDCDTEFASGTRMTAEQIAQAALDAQGLPEPCIGSWVVLTGGEPALQADSELIQVLHAHGFKVAIETNGSINVDAIGLDWITVSPKVAEHCVRQLTATEVKYVRGHGQAIPKSACKATYQLISPAFNGLTIDRKSLDWCSQLVKRDPTWRLSVQMHKAWNIR